MFYLLMFIHWNSTELMPLELLLGSSLHWQTCPSWN